MKVAIGSKNPVKIMATKLAFEAVFPEEPCEIIPMQVSSGVESQPMTDEESVKGAENRAQAAVDATKADYGVGIEAGLEQVGDVWLTSAWVVVLNMEGKRGVGSAPKVEVSPAIISLIKEGKELGEACDTVFGRTNMKQAEGYIGHTTKGLVTRTASCRDAVITALVPFVNRELFIG